MVNKVAKDKTSAPVDGDDSLNPFDPERLRLSQDFGQSLGVKNALVTVPVRKPSKEWWVRTHPDEKCYWIETAVLELKDGQDRAVYLVERELWPELAAESTFSARVLITAINRQGVLFLWQIRLPRPDGRIDEWNRSALAGAAIAQRTWVRVTPNMSLGAYDVFEPSVNIPQPDWPPQSFSKILQIAFNDRRITSMDHPVIKELRGQA